jgi:DNA-directed RNA polymerase specialized sigma subunit
LRILTDLGSWEPHRSSFSGFVGCYGRWGMILERYEISIPREVYREYLLLKKTRNELQRILQRSPTDIEVSEKSGISLEKMAELRFLPVRGKIVSYTESDQEDEETS